MEENKAFTETRIYPILFMTVITVIFVGILAFFYHSTKSRIQENEMLSFQNKVLMLFDLPVEDIRDSFQKYITPVSHKGELNYFVAKKDGNELGYAFVISGPGLWGTITALVAIDSQFRNIIKFDILSQNETPGLGGRITEDGFKSQFTKKMLVKDNKIIEYKLISEDESPTDMEVSQITGATFSSQSVTKMLYKELKIISKELGFSYE